MQWGWRNGQRMRLFAAGILVAVLAGSTACGLWLTYRALVSWGKGETSASAPPTAGKAADWYFLALKHPDRHVSLRLNAVRTGDVKFQVSADYVIDTETSDPLVARVRSGLEAAGAGSPLGLLQPNVLLELPLDEENRRVIRLIVPPGIPHLETQKNHARITTHTSLEAAGHDGTPKTGLPWMFDLSLAVIEIPSSTPPLQLSSTTIVESWDLSATMRGTALAGVRNLLPAQQTSTALTYRGSTPRSRIRLAVAADNGDRGEVLGALQESQEWYAADEKATLSHAVSWMVLLLPLAALLLLLPHAPDARVRGVRRPLAVAFILVCAFGTMSGVRGSPTFQLTGIIGMTVVVPLGLLLVGRRIRGRPAVVRADALWCSLLPVAAMASDDLSSGQMIISVTAGCGFAAVIALTRYPWARLVAFLASWLACGLVEGASIAGGGQNVPNMITIGLMWSPLAMLVIRLVTPVRPVPAWAAAVVVGVLYTNSPARFFNFSTYLDGFGWEHETSLLIATAGGIGLSLISIAVAFWFLRRRGSSPDAAAEPGVRIAALVLVLSTCVTMYLPFGNLLPTTITIALLAWLVVPRSRAAPAGRLATVSRPVHARLVRLELRRRLLRDTERELFGWARSRLADGTLKIPELDQRSREIDESAGPHEISRNGLQIREAAFSSAGGFRPIDNAAASIVIGILLSSPVIVWELVRSHLDVPESYVWYTVDMLRHVGRWAAYAAFFGLLYPWVRGHTPIVKAMHLLVAILPGELLWILNAEATTRDRVLATVALAGQTTVFSLALGLFWERRLLAAADLPWTILRTARSLRSLAVPVSTVLVAAGTAAATALGGALVDPIVNHQETPASVTTPAPVGTPPAAGH